MRGVTRCGLLMLGVGSMLVLILSVLVDGPVLKVRCLALVDDAVDHLGVIDVELHVVLGLRPRSS
jgi:hypothetical protein